MFTFLSRGKYGPPVQVGLGLAVVVIGLFVMPRVLVPLGGLLAVWGIALSVRRRRACNRERDESAAQ